MPGLVRKIIRLAWAIFGVALILRQAVLGTDSKVIQVVGSAVSAWILVFEVGRLASKTPPTAEDHPQGGRRRPKAGGNWLAAPVAEIDKSTTGQLLASRLRRDPNLNVEARSGTSPDADPRAGPLGRDGLWDRELDG